ncbi:Aste57867_20230 [Aphanomyces stellatus]|uniref:Aste57867_20230 protein n=1 Tax=Aphanomyces stellatus TaxID=120398 RepID=A0A485LEI2_9STRA|nr:hypothetical protein As57867_020164 [Aphanomyces stellatus]VFT96922.1 Aste57867_20230 [Aphanomyces stellatus]
MRIEAALVAAASLAALVHAACPRAPASGLICNGRGDCTPLGECRCGASAFGFDCSQVRCPMGIAWSGDAVGVNQIHVPAECSNRGVCSRDAGQCVCDAGFTGVACDKLACPGDCSKSGLCVPMSQLALLRSPYGYVYNSIWDAQQIFGFVSSWMTTQHDISVVATCPNGDDPMTIGQVNEIQLIKCTATAGFFFVKFNGQTSGAIGATATTAQLTQILQVRRLTMVVDDALTRLQSVPPFGVIKVTYSFGTTVCDAAGRNIVSMEFRSNFGAYRSSSSSSKLIFSLIRQPSIVVVSLQNGNSTILGGSLVVASAGSAIGSTLSVTGTKEWLPCSNRGACDQRTGHCSCYVFPMPGFRSSDGYGNIGVQGDCGAPDNTNFYGGAISGCPGYIPCSGHGACSGTPSFLCTCAVGWYSGDCSLRDCPHGLSWFSLPTASNVAHTTWTTCSDAGTCDHTTGECLCTPPFGGAACEYMQCPKGADGAHDCSGHGVCLTLSALAEATTLDGVPAGYTYGAVANNASTWDATSIKGCKCDVGFTGHDCSLLTCPTGDDPLTLNQVNDIQRVTCTATSGVFQVVFRGATSTPIPYNAPSTVVQTALLAMTTITGVVVTFSQSGGGACVGGNAMTLEFTQNFGSLPRLMIIDQGLLRTGGLSQAGTTLVTKMQTGTKEDVVCSNHGTCDRATGVCACGLGFGSSDGNGNPGKRGDCGYVMPWQVVVA